MISGCPFHTRIIDASHFMQQYMLEMVEARRKADKTEQRHDLFSGLLDATAEESDDVVTLSDQELLGKCPMPHHFAYSESVSYSLS